MTVASVGAAADATVVVVASLLLQMARHTNSVLASFCRIEEPTRLGCSRRASQMKRACPNPFVTLASANLWCSSHPKDLQVQECK